MPTIASILKQQAAHPQIPVAFVGLPGAGKTAQIEDWCEKNSKVCVKILASTMDTTDVAGIIVSTAEKRVVKVDGELTIQTVGKGSAEQLSPKWSTYLENGGVLFLDELNCAMKEVQDTLLSLIHSRHFPNGDRLHPQVQIVAAMNDSVQCNNYVLSPAMRNRFAWYTVQPSMKQWLHWASKQLSEEFNVFLFRAVGGGLKFSTDADFMDETQLLFCTPRSLWNCIEWSNKDVKQFLTNMNNFLPKPVSIIFKAVDKEAIADRSNAVFNRLRAEIQNVQDFDEILEKADSDV